MNADPQKEFQAVTDPMAKRLGVFAAMKGVVPWLRWDSDHRLKWIDDAENIWAFDATTSQVTELVNWQRLKEAIEPAYSPDPMPETALGLAAARVDADEMFMELPIRGRLRRVDLANYGLGPPLSEPPPDKPRLLRKSRLTGNAGKYETRGPESIAFAGIDEEHNLFVRRADTEKRRLLTTDGTELAQWRSPAWSPDGAALVVQRALTEGVNRIPLVDWLDPHGAVEFELKALAGEPIECLELWLFDVESGERRKLDARIQPDQKVFFVGWAGDGRYFFLRAHRDLRQIDLMELQPATGNCRVVMGETYTSLFSWFDLGSLVTPIADDWSELLWRSERDGWGHLYRYDIAGNLLGRVTEGQYVVNDVAGVDERGGWVYFDGSSELHPYDTQLYRARLDGSETQRLTSDPGQHSITLSPAKDWFVDRYSNLQVPTRVDVRRSDGEVVRTISIEDASELLAQGYAPPEEIVVTAADGVTPLHGVLYTPAHFDEGGRYPILDSIYGGPNEIWAPKTYSDPRGVVPQAMTALGFAVVVLDGRGTPRRGKAFHDAGGGGFGAHVIADHVTGLRQLADRYSWIDLDRVGVFGGSWGGYMTIRALLTAPDVFKVGVAAAGSAQLTEGAFSIEPFLGLPRDNPDGYRDSDLVARAGDLKGHLMIIHGTLDANAPFGAAMRMARALIDVGKDFELVVLPGENHHAKGSAAIFRLSKQAQFFLRHLGEKETT